VNFSIAILFFKKFLYVTMIFWGKKNQITVHKTALVLWLCMIFIFLIFLQRTTKLTVLWFRNTHLKTLNPRFFINSNNNTTRGTYLPTYLLIYLPTYIHQREGSRSHTPVIEPRPNKIQWLSSACPIASSHVVGSSREGRSDLFSNLPWRKKERMNEWGKDFTMYDFGRI